MLSRRSLLMSSACLAALPLAGCGGAVKNAIDATYTELVTVAKIFENAIAVAAKDAVNGMKTAIATITPYIVPCCRLVVSMDTLGQTLVTNGTLKPSSGSTLAAALAGLHTTATTTIVASTAQTGATPSDPVAVATDLIQIAALIISASRSRITPTAAATA